MHSPRSAKRAIALLSITALAAAFPLTSASAQQAPPVTDIGPGGSVALIVPTVSCAIRTPLVDTYWFGYVNNAGYSITVPVGASNKIPRTAFRQTFIDAAQPDQFRPGTTSRSVAVQVAHNASATWTISAYTPDGVTLLTASATASAATPACARSVSPNSANVRVADASISYAPETQTRDAAGLLRTATVKFSVAGVRTVCSLGGVPNTPSLLWGWVDEFGVPASTQAAFYSPLAASEVVRSDTFVTNGRFGAGTVTFQRTIGSVRTVADPQRAVTQLRSDGVTLTTSGWSLVVPTVDVDGTCNFFGKNVAAGSGYFGGEEGQFSYSITDLATQTTRKPVLCAFGVATCDVLQEIVGPGGIRMNR
jgi:hypothetical protein